MATIHNNVQVQQFKATGDLSAQQYNVMRINDGQDGVVVCSNAADPRMCGVLTNKPAASGRAAGVAYAGEYKARAGAAVSSTGMFLTVNGSGRVIVAGSGLMALGTNLETAAADGDLISVQLMKPFQLGPLA